MPRPLVANPAPPDVNGPTAIDIFADLYDKADPKFNNALKLLLSDNGDAEETLSLIHNAFFLDPFSSFVFIEAFGKFGQLYSDPIASKIAKANGNLIRL